MLLLATKHMPNPVPARWQQKSFSLAVRPPTFCLPRCWPAHHSLGSSDTAALCSGSLSLFCFQCSWLHLVGAQQEHTLCPRDFSLSRR